MPWTHEETIGLARVRCPHCHGQGLRLGNASGRRGLTPCACVLRAIFRCCFIRYLEYSEPTVGSVNPEFHPRARTAAYHRPRENYCADFCLIAGRTLSPSEMDLFRLYFLWGLPWEICAPRLGVDRGNFFHAVYRVEAKLGRAFRDTSPYALYPVDEYFNGRPADLAVPTPLRLVRRYGRSKCAEDFTGAVQCG